MHAPISSTSRVSLASDGTVEGYASLFGEVAASAHSSSARCARSPRSVKMRIRSDMTDPGALAHPSPLWGGWLAEGQSGGCSFTSTANLTYPHPDLAFARSTLPTRERDKKIHPSRSPSATGA